MESMCKTYEICPMANKVEIFLNALDKTTG